MASVSSPAPVPTSIGIPPTNDPPPTTPPLPKVPAWVIVLTTLLIFILLAVSLYIWSLIARPQKSSSDLEIGKASGELDNSEALPAKCSEAPPSMSQRLAFWRKRSAPAPREIQLKDFHEQINADTAPRTGRPNHRHGRDVEHFANHKAREGTRKREEEARKREEEGKDEGQREFEEVQLDVNPTPGEFNPYGYGFRHA